MHKLRLKKLETKQRAQEELKKRDAEIQRVRNQEPEARTPFNNYRKHIAGILNRNIVSILDLNHGLWLISDSLNNYVTRRHYVMAWIT